MIVAEDLLSYSKELYKNSNNNEVALRNVARNSYYALFHELANIDLKAIPLTERSFGSHEQLIQQLRASDEQEYRKLGVLLASLKSVRNKADYKLKVHFSDHCARSTLMKVDKAFKELFGPRPEVSEVNENKSDVKNSSTSAEVVQKSTRNSPPKLSVVK
ncbi:hypothetical protein ABZP26_19275 [Pseudoalteromonas sp. SD03]|uniref:HEPN domain-containing protein n=1 Tax=Pseudoalteromonas sp. SD03 TaxID=3231719 RepID=A0AB39AV71_9GAMM